MSSKDTEAEDPNDYVTSRRLKELYDARKNVLKANERATELRVKGKSLAGQQIYREAVKGYLLEIQPLLFEFEEKELWYSRSFGSVSVDPPNEELESPSNLVPHLYELAHQGETILVEEPLPSSTEYEVQGFSTLVTENSPLFASFEYEPHKTFRDKITRSKEFYIPISALDQMVISANNFLAEYGLDINPDEGLPTHE